MAEDRTPDTGTAGASTTDETEELTMDERPAGATGTGTAPTAAGSTRHADDDAPWSVPAGTTGTTGATGATPTTPEVARGVRVGTVVWGLVVVVAGVLLAAAAAGVVFDVQLAVIATVALAGVALVVGSLVSAGRRRDRSA
jgi:hypothetical protein